MLGYEHFFFAKSLSLLAENSYGEDGLSEDHAELLRREGGLLMLAI